MAFNDILRLRIVYGYGSMVMNNVMHFVEELPVYAPGTPNTLALAQDFMNNMSTSLRARTANNVQFLRIEVQPVVPYGAESAILDYGTNTFGTQAQATHVPFATENVTIYSNQIGRRKRGRIYLPPGSLNTMASGSWTSAQTALTQTFVTAMVNRYIGNTLGTTWYLGIWSRVLAGPAPPWPTSAFTRATRLQVRTVMRTQRRRQVGVGR